MILRTSFPRLLWAATVFAALVSLPLLPASRAAEGSREQQIAELEKQIADLTRKLNELKGQPPIPPPQQVEGLPTDWTKALVWRSIGPAAMGGRIVALSIYEADPSTYWVATASGGLLKTVNNGVTFEHQFDREATVSIGDVCVAPSDRNIVWVGAGENNPRNSVSYGDGVYKSTDGGKTWKNMGLKKTFQIGKVLVHPRNPEIVYVGALGRLYGDNEERGLFKTEDGGKTWNKILYVDAKTGVIDMRMSPADPETLLVATWERRRDEFDSHRGEPAVADGYDPYDPIKKWGPGTGIHRTTDGGKTFTKMTKGLPSGAMGRIGLDWYRKDPKIVFAIIDCENIGKGNPPRNVQGGGVYLGVVPDTEEVFDAKKGLRMAEITPKSPADKAGLKPNDRILTINEAALENAQSLSRALRNLKVGDKVKLGVKRAADPLKVYEVTLEERPAPTTRPNSFAYGGQRENVQETQGPNSHEYGGVYKSTDAGETWTRINSLNPRPMYFSQVRVDPSDEKYLYILGISLYRSSDGGKTFKADGDRGVHPDQHCLWIDPKDGRHMIVGCDGGFYATYDRMDNWDFLNQMAIGQFYHVAVDNKKPFWVYGGLQDNGSWAGPSRSLNSNGLINEDWIVVGGGDGFVCRVDPTDNDLVYYESQDGAMLRRNLRTGEGAFLRARENREKPLHRYNWNTPFILSVHNPRIFYSAGEVVFRSVKQGMEQKVISREIARTKRGTGTALAESPRNPDVLWAGTDDGFLWVTKDGGANWTNVLDKVGLPGPRWVATIEASRFKEGRAYVVFDGHRSDDDEPYVFVTEDYGETWKPLRNNLPTGSTRCLREDLEKENVLYLGTEFGAWASINRGATWTRINNNLPTVAVHEFAQHPDGEMAAATHGRSLWILDVTPLRQMTPETPKAAATLYKPAALVRWRTEPEKGSPYGVGSRLFAGTNPPRAVLYYSLGKKADKISLKVVDYTGKTVRDLGVKGDAGLHRILWDPPGGAGRFNRSPLPPPGQYRVVLTVDGAEQSQGLKIETDPTQPAGVIVNPFDGEEARRKAKLSTPIDD